MADFELAIKKLLRIEGGLSSDKNDPGGETKYGISKRSHPHLDIKNLTPAQARQIYHDEWWERYGYGRLLSQEAATDLLLFAVHAGPLTAHTVFQRSLNAFGAGLRADGVLGFKTIAAEAAIVDRVKLAWFFKLNIIRYYLSCDGANRYLRGWIRRVVDVKEA